jgi:transcriptional regulator with XRE-family HTH domain
MHTPTVTHPILDYLIERFGLKNDSAICKLIGTSRSEISKIRHGKVRGRPSIAVAINEVFGLSFKQMRELGGEDFVGVRPPKGQR